MHTEKKLLQRLKKRNFTLISVLIQLLLNGETSDVTFMLYNLRNFPCDFVYLFFSFNLKEPKLLLSSSSLVKPNGSIWSIACILFDLNYFIKICYCLILKILYDISQIYHFSFLTNTNILQNILGSYFDRYV